MNAELPAAGYNAKKHSRLINSIPIQSISINKSEFISFPVMKFIRINWIEIGIEIENWNWWRGMLLV